MFARGIVTEVIGRIGQINCVVEANAGRQARSWVKVSTFNYLEHFGKTTHSTPKLSKQPTEIFEFLFSCTLQRSGTGLVKSALLSLTKAIKED